MGAEAVVVDAEEIIVAEEIIIVADISSEILAWQLKAETKESGLR